MSKLLALGVPLDDVVRRATWNPAQEVKQESIGHLTVGATADLAVLRLEHGRFGFVDSYGARLHGRTRLVCELTLREGNVVFDLNGLTKQDWDTLAPDYGSTPGR
jgi:dihydroorotase